MRRFLRKPAGIKTQEFVARVSEMNIFLREFPLPNGEAATALPEDEILDLLIWCAKLLAEAVSYAPIQSASPHGYGIRRIL